MLTLCTNVHSSLPIPKKEHADAGWWLTRYLKGTKDQEIIYNQIIQRGLELFLDADFAGNWIQKESWDKDTGRWRYKYFVMFTSCPIEWKIQIQTEIAL